MYLELVWQSDASLFAIARALLVKHIFYSPIFRLNLDYLNCETAFGRVGKAAVRRRSAAHYSEHTVVFVPWRFLRTCTHVCTSILLHVFRKPERLLLVYIIIIISGS